MKRVLMTLMIAAVLLPLMAAAVCAQSDYNWLVLVNMNNINIAGTGPSYYQYAALDPSKQYVLDYDGQAGLATAVIPGISLVGSGTGGNIWQFYYTTSNTAYVGAPTINLAAGSGYTQFSSEAGPLLSLGTMTSSGSGTITVSGITGIAVGYDVTFKNPGFIPAVATGSADVTAYAKAVPEPGTILAALSILGPAGFVFRRRKLA